MVIAYRDAAANLRTFLKKIPSSQIQIPSARPIWYRILTFYIRLVNIFTNKELGVFWKNYTFAAQYCLHMIVKYVGKELQEGRM